MVNIWSIFAQMTDDGCPLCGRPGDGICTACRGALPRNHHPCPRCALPMPAPTGVPCADCQRRPPHFDVAIAPLLYLSPVDDLLAGFKYHQRLSYGRLLGGLLGDALQRSDPGPTLLLPMPAHAERLRERGFNQAAELARHLARRLGIAWDTRSLRRVGSQPPQRGLGRAARRRNLRDAFQCDLALPAHVALIDDVITTGASADMASRVLRRAGAQRIEVWAVARTPRDRQG